VVVVGTNALRCLLTSVIVNGGPPGVLYEFLTAAVYYGFIGASIAEVGSQKKVNAMVDIY